MSNNRVRQIMEEKPDQSIEFYLALFAGLWERHPQDAPTPSELEEFVRVGWDETFQDSRT